MPDALPGFSLSEVEENSFYVANLEVRLDELEVLAGGQRVGLTVREFQTFLALAVRPDRVVRRPVIYEDVWGGQMAHRDRSVDVYVRKVRHKLERAAPEWRYIHTHFGLGYRFAPERNGRPGEPFVTQ
jgi:DNA-binding response OmpR family regulator